MKDRNYNTTGIA